MKKQVFVKVVLSIVIVVMTGKNLKMWADSISVNNCDAISGWNISTGTIGDINVNSEIKIEGANSIKFTVKKEVGKEGWGEVVYTLSGANNWSMGEVFSFWLYLDENAGKINICELYIYDINNNYHKWIFYYKLPLRSWQYYTFWLNSPCESSDAPLNLNNISKFVIRFQQPLTSSIDFSIFIDDVRLYFGYEKKMINKVETRCSELEAKEEVAAKALVAQEISPWIDISRYLTSADKARGFVEIGISFIGGSDERWIFMGDDDGGGDNDLRALCDGVIYEVIDERYKTSQYQTVVFPLGGKYTGAKSGSLAVIPFGVPRNIYENYKIFLGVGNLQPALLSIGQYVGKEWVGVRPFWIGTYYRAEVYVISPLPGLYADFRMVDVFEDAYWEYNKIREKFDYKSGVYNVPQGVEVEFDGSLSVSYDLPGVNIVDYSWDFGDGTILVGAKVKKKFNEVGSYVVSLTVTGSDGKTYPEYPYARKSIIVNVVSPPAEVKLYQNAPNPFVLSTPNSTTKIKYELSHAGKVNLSVHKLTGELVKKIIANEEKEAGFWEAEWDGKNETGELVNSGVYIYVLNVSGKRVYNKMLVIR